MCQSGKVFKRGIVVLLLLGISLLSGAQRTYLYDQLIHLSHFCEKNDYVGKVLTSLIYEVDSAYFQILSGDGTGAFIINSNDGVLTINDPAQVDYSVNSVYRLDVGLLKIGANDTLDKCEVEIQILDPAKTIYIDPDNTGDGSRDGSYDHPYSGWWEFSIANGYNYLQKRGTEYAGLINASEKSNIVISAYGQGNKPKLDNTGQYQGINLRGASNSHVSEFEIFNGLRAGVTMNHETLNTTNVHVRYCLIHHCNTGIDPGTGSYIFGNVIHDMLEDGIFVINKHNVVMECNNFYNINMRYVSLPDPSTAHESQAPGDGIQLGEDCSGFVIRDNIIDRSNTSFKFSIICTGPETNGFTVENNILIGPIATYAGGSVFVNGKNGVVRNNKIINSIHAVYNHSSNVLIHHNIMAGHTSSGVYTSASAKIYNNVFYDNNNGISGAESAIGNNIFYLTSPNQYVHTVSNTESDDNIQNIPARGTNQSRIMDPLFIDPPSYNFRLSSNSPCIDIGENYGFTHDFEYSPIPYNGIPDIGVYEYSPGKDVNYKPIAKIPSKVNSVKGALVNIDGAQSYDPNGDSILFSWLVPIDIVYENETKNSISFNVPANYNKDSIVIGLYVSDYEYKSDTVFCYVLIEQTIEINPLAKKLNIVSVKASSDDGNLPAYVLDNNFDTRWSAEGQGQWIEFELDGEHELDHVKTAWYKGDERVAYFAVSTSLDGTSWSEALTDAETSGESNDLQVFATRKNKAKYVRIIGFGNTSNLWNSITEAEFYGLPAAKITEYQLEDLMSMFGDHVCNVYEIHGRWIMQIELSEIYKAENRLERGIYFFKLEVNERNYVLKITK
ncbi:MAG: discoidin domain-containing protein [Bacteroidales bacterium]|nr:discoidin domain-containing protein [Bacteroidales bacterium]